MASPELERISRNRTQSLKPKQNWPHLKNGVVLFPMEKNGPFVGPHRSEGRRSSANRPLVDGTLFNRLNAAGLIRHPAQENLEHTASANFNITLHGHPGLKLNLQSIIQQELFTI